MITKLSSDVKQYALITANYWGFTLTDGALRMLVVLFFHQLGYSPLEIALLFIFYEFFGVVTNLLGGWLGARLGLNQTMNLGLALQIAALTMLSVPQALLTVFWVMSAQALSGVAKDLNKMSAKSAIKLLVPEDQSSTLYTWVARLTGSKNTLKGIGYFLGGALLMTVGFQASVVAMAVGLTLMWLLSLVLLKRDLGRSSNKPKFTELFSKSRAINLLSAARLFLFGARDVWFVVAIPVYFSAVLEWEHWQVGTFMACWIILYGVVQTQAPKITGRSPDGHAAFLWVTILTFTPLLIVGLLLSDISKSFILITGLTLFGFVFAINSSLHSYLIVEYADSNAVSMDVGFYYMANAGGRLIGTVLSGALYQWYGLIACLLVSTLFLVAASLISLGLPRQKVIQH